jgi:MFS family permease
MDKQRPIIVMALITAACLLGDSMLYIVLPVHWQEMGLTSLWQIGIILAMNRIVRIPLNPLVSKLYQKISARSGMTLAVLLAAGTTAAYGVVSSFTLFILLRCLWGLAWTFLRLGAYFTILDCATDANRGRSMGQYNGLYRLGSLGGMLFGGVLADTVGVTVTCTLFGFCSLAALPFVWKFVPAGERGLVAAAAAAEQDYHFGQHMDVLKILIAGTFLALVFQGMLNSTLSYLIKVHYPSGLSLAGLVLGAASLGGVLQAIRWGWEPWLAPLCGKLTDGPRGRFPLLVGAAWVAGFCFALVSWQLSLALWIVLVMVLQLTATALTTVADAVAADVAVGSAKVKIMTLYSLLIDVGAAIGPVLAYFANQYLHPLASCYIAAAALLFLAAYYFPAARQGWHAAE